MKRYFIGLLAAIALLQGCSISRAVHQQRNLLSGTWTLTDVRYANTTGAFQATLFGDADAICFEDSEWFFRDNNSTGRYTIAQGSLCQGGDRFFRWSIDDRSENYKNTFQFKFIDEKRKDLTGQGYRLIIDQLTESDMQLSHIVQSANGPVTIQYFFSKK